MLALAGAGHCHWIQIAKLNSAASTATSLRMGAPPGLTAHSPRTACSFDSKRRHYSTG
ncbi:hypothetical protein GCM10010260_59690 [Streptomyces filipinensis]|uniref:Uncharacterized protein n=1 Tax=Streptomyces filipinensis TaxID=66887 RepID=A0A918IHX2_9ACTN|nr:hypothetical protein GCM10010260_59690 [Streptomyces filipinensis]